MKKVLLIAGGIIVALALAFVSTPYVLSLVAGGDDELSDDSALIPSEVEVADQDNSYKLLHALKFVEGKPDEAKKLIEWSSYTSIDEIDWQAVEEIVNRNQAGIDQFNEAAAKKFYQSPYTVSIENLGYSKDAPIETFGEIRNMARIASLRALLLARQGQIEPAIDQALSVMMVGAHIQNSQTSTISYLVGVSQAQLGLNTYQALHKNYELSDGQKSYVKTFIELNRPTSAGLKSIIQYEYIIQKQGMEDIKAGKIPGGTDHETDEAKIYNKYSSRAYYFKPNQTLNEANLFFSKQLQFIETPCEYYLESSEPLTWRVYITENAVGKTLNQAFFTAEASVMNKACENFKLFNETLNF